MITGPRYVPVSTEKNTLKDILLVDQRLVQDIKPKLQSEG